MNSEHPGEQVLQQFVLDRSSCDQDIIIHMETCLLCQQKAAEYDLLFSGLRSLKIPAVETDLVALVMPVIQQPARREKPAMVLGKIALVVGLPVTALLYYLFRTSLSSIIKPFTPWLLAMALITVLGLFFIFLSGIYAQYKKQADLLNSF